MATRPRRAETTVDTADAGSPAGETLKVLISGMVALSVATAAASVFSQLNTGRFLPILLVLTSCVITVFTGCLTWAALLHALGGGPHGAVVLLGLTLPLASWFLVYANHEYWLLGPAVADVTVAEAGRHRYASSFRFRDARVATELLGVKSVTQGGGRGHHPRTEWYYVAPVVYEGWSPEQPLSLWAGAPVNNYYSTLENWAKPHRAGVQLSSCELRYLREAATNSEEQHGIRALDGTPFIRWTPEPETEVARARKFVLWVAAGNNLLLLLLLAGTSLPSRLRRSYREAFYRR